MHSQNFTCLLKTFSLSLLLASLPQSLGADDPPPSIQALIAKVKPSVATIQMSGRDGDQLAVGTGFVIDAEGLIATNYHVIGEGRPFSVELSSGRKLPVLAVQASDRRSDLAIIRVDVQDDPLAALELESEGTVAQGLRILAFGNPLGLRGSVVEGIVSAVREIEGRELIQLAMPTEPGNSGGPIVDQEGRVRGIVNMKSAIEQNLGFAIPASQLAELQAKPNPIDIDRWVLLEGINQERWTTRMGSRWQQRGGRITARGMGEGFGGRSLCLSTQPEPELPYDVVAMVRLDDEAGAAGLAFFCDEKNRHYGFYPSGGRMRFACFLGPTVYSWQVLEEIESPHYLPGQWNRLRVRVEKDRIRCYVNGHLVVESTDRQLQGGSIGLVKFRDTNPDFKAFRIGADLQSKPISPAALAWLATLKADPDRADQMGTQEVRQLAAGGDVASQALVRHALALEEQAKLLRQLAADVTVSPLLKRLSELFAAASDETAEPTNPEDRESQRLLRGALLIAAIDQEDIDVDAYERRIDEMAKEILADLDDDADPATRLDALDDYLFQQNGFRGGRTEYYHKANSHLNRVIDDREGLPITLSILHMELGRRIGLTIQGVGLPGHFVVRQLSTFSE